MSDRKKAPDFHPGILEIYDGHVHGWVTKRDFLCQVGQYAAAGVTGAMILDALQPDHALAQQVPPEDPAINVETASYDSPDGHGRISGLKARPADPQGKLSAVLVVHENR